jgi:GR25 family glycosyltransferase involved in LPS biosynthesis
MHILNKYCDSIFVISIDKYNRKEYINNELSDIEFQYFDGVDGSLLTEDEYNTYLNNRLPNSHGLKKGNLGCSRSHLELYKKIYVEKLNNVLILEDDIKLTDNIHNLEYYFNQLPIEYDLVYFGMNNGNINYDNVLNPNYTNNIFKLDRGILQNSNIYNIEGTNAYFIKNYKFVEKLITFQEKWLYTADGCLMEYLKEYRLTYYIFLPQLIKTNDNIFSISKKIDNNN